MRHKRSALLVAVSSERGYLLEGRSIPEARGCEQHDEKDDKRWEQRRCVITTPSNSVNYAYNQGCEELHYRTDLSQSGASGSPFKGK